MLRTGWHVRAMIRKGAVSPFDPHERLQVVHGDMRNAASLVTAVGGSAAVVHLAAAKSDEADSEDVNVGGARRLVDACHAGGCTRLINISTQSVKIARRGIYARTKSEADSVFRDGGLALTTLLPSVVYGEAKDGVFGTILQMVQKAPVVPILGDGKWLSAPVYIGDLCQAVIACLQRPQSIGKDYDIGGPDLIRFDELVDRIAGAAGVKRPKVHIPLTVALWLAGWAARLPHPPITISNVLGSNQDTGIDIRPACTDLAFEPSDLTSGLERVFCKALRPAADPLAEDCKLIARYLLDDDPAPELVERYRAGCNSMLASSDPTKDRSWSWVRTHPWSLPFMDAAAAWLEPSSPVRLRIYLMAALLEATPAHSAFFLRPSDARARLLAGLIWQSMRSAAKMVIGIPLWAFVRTRHGHGV